MIALHHHIQKLHKVPVKKTLHGLLWFFLGATLGLFFFVSFLFITYKNIYTNKVYPGVFVNGVDFSGKTQQEVKTYFVKKNLAFAPTLFSFQGPGTQATTSARELNFGYDTDLLSQQAFSIGRTGNLFSDVSLLLQAYTNGIYLEASYQFSHETLKKIFDPIVTKLSVKPVNAIFTYQNNRVVEFRPHSDGQAVDMTQLQTTLLSKMPLLLSTKRPSLISIKIPLKILHPDLTIDKANNMGINELVGSGTSLFEGSIENRIYNISLSSSRINGVLIAPNEVFSFAKAVGDVSSLTGYKQAYVIENGKTVLGDGGGVCQVSTTLFRAALSAGLPIVERNPHAYRVHYYEEDSGPGIDAAVYVPSVDLKFKNDTPHWLLIQTIFDPNAERLTFELYGTKDDREVTINDPVVVSQTPAPDPLYQDDPTLPKGQVKQIDFSAAGANVYFTRQVKKDGKIVLADKFVSHYQPWRAVFLRGTKEN